MSCSPREPRIKYFSSDELQSKGTQDQILQLLHNMFEICRVKQQFDKLLNSASTVPLYKAESHVYNIPSSSDLAADIKNEARDGWIGMCGLMWF